MPEARTFPSDDCRHIVLIHGAWQGKWAFDPWLPSLHAHGWKTHAVDLPGNGWPPGEGSAANLDTYAAHVTQLIEAIGESVIVLGHSGGGVTASQVAESIPDRVAAVVYLAGLMLPSGVTAAELISELMKQHPGTDMTGIASWLSWNADRTHTSVPMEGALHCFFQDCDPQEARQAASLLTPQPQTGRVMRNHLTARRFGTVPRVYVECLKDMSILPAFQRHMQALSPGALRLSMDCGHVPQLAQPEALSTLLLPELETLLARHRTRLRSADPATPPSNFAPSLTTHVIDTALSAGAADMRITLSFRGGEGSRVIENATTDEHGRASFITQLRLMRGEYELLFHAGSYLRGRHAAAPEFIADIPVVFSVSEPGKHHHVPLLLAPGGYTVYRGGLPPAIA